METTVEEQIDTLDFESVLARVDDWQARIEALYLKLIAWLPPHFTSDTSQSVEMMEERMISFGIGERKLPVLNVFEQDVWKAKIIPYGLWVVGADGQLDFLTPKNRYYIVGRVPDDGAGWRIARTDGDLRQVDLDRSAWVSAIQ